jgi:hypothetical protein
MKLGILVDGSLQIMHILFCSSFVEKCLAMATNILKIGLKYVKYIEDIK